MDETYHVFYGDRQYHKVFISLSSAALQSLPLEPCDLLRIRVFTYSDLIRTTLYQLSRKGNHRVEYKIRGATNKLIWVDRSSKYDAVSEFFTRTTPLLPMGQRAYALEEITDFTYADKQRARSGIAQSYIRSFYDN